MGGGGGIIVDVPYVVGCSLLFAIKKNGEKSPKNVHYHTKDLSCEDFLNVSERSLESVLTTAAFIW